MQKKPWQNVCRLVTVVLGSLLALPVAVSPGLPFTPRAWDHESLYPKPLHTKFVEQGALLRPQHVKQSIWEGRGVKTSSVSNSTPKAAMLRTGDFTRTMGSYVLRQKRPEGWLRHKASEKGTASGSRHLIQQRNTAKENEGYRHICGVLSSLLCCMLCLFRVEHRSLVIVFAIVPPRARAAS